MTEPKTKWIDDVFLFDNLKFVSIFGICFYHASNGVISLNAGLPNNKIMFFLANGIISFAIPLFAFVSGFSGKNLKNTGFFRKTISVYLAANLLYIPYYISRTAAENTIPHVMLLITGPCVVFLWYFLALIGWKLITPSVMQLRYPWFLSTLGVIALYSVSEMLVGQNDIFDKWILVTSLRLAIRGYPFYLLGVIATRDNLLRLRRSKFKILLIPPAVLGFYLCGSGVISNDPATHGLSQCTLYLTAAICCSAALLSIIPGKSLKYITPLGQRTLGIYVFHTYLLKGACTIVAWHALNLLSSSRGLFPLPLIYLLLVYGTCFLSSRTFLTVFLNKLSLQIEMLLFSSPIPVMP